MKLGQFLVTLLFVSLSHFICGMDNLKIKSVSTSPIAFGDRSPVVKCYDPNDGSDFSFTHECSTEESYRCTKNKQDHIFLEKNRLNVGLYYVFVSICRPCSASNCLFQSLNSDQKS